MALLSFFIGAMMWSLCLLPGGLRRFVPCSIGANHCRLRHIGWEKCGHGLTSRPRESASELFLIGLSVSFVIHLNQGVLWLVVLFLFGIVLLVLHIVLKLGGYRFLGMLNALLLHSGAGDCRGKVVRVNLVCGSGPARKRFRLNRKTPAHLAGFLSHSRPRVWKRQRQDGFSGSSLPDHTRRRCDHAYGGSVHEHDRIEVG